MLLRNNALYTINFIKIIIMKVLRKIYNVINNSIQSRVVNSKEEANKYIISFNRTLENKVSLETVNNKQVEAVKINGKWCISETEIIE
nr:MAG TPA: hypothetical protein [Crassvirales sp.]